MWESIESAPRDGSIFLISNGVDVHPAFFNKNGGKWLWAFIDDTNTEPLGCCDDESMDRISFNGYDNTGTKWWMPLPDVSSILKPCPFCGGICNPTGAEGVWGDLTPVCVDCGATADGVERWNTRPEVMRLNSVIDMQATLIKRCEEVLLYHTKMTRPISTTEHVLASIKSYHDGQHHE